MDHDPNTKPPPQPTRGDAPAYTLPTTPNKDCPEAPWGYDENGKARAPYGVTKLGRPKILRQTRKNTAREPRDGEVVVGGVPVRVKQVGEPGTMRPRAYLPFDHERKAIFVAKLRETGLWVRAREAAVINVQTQVQHLATDVTFAAECEEALESYKACLVEAMHARAVMGVDEPIVGGRNKDEIVAYVKRFSDNLLMSQLRKHDPSYREKYSVETTGTSTLKHQVDLGSLPQLVRDKLRETLVVMKQAMAVKPGALPGLPVGSGPVLDANSVDKEPKK